MHDHGEHQIDLKQTFLEQPDASVVRVLDWNRVSLEVGGKLILNDISASVLAGELTCLCGSNGAGKTQLIRLALGLIKPSLGAIRLLGRDPIESRHLVGYVPQLKAFNRNFPASVEDVLVAAVRGRWPLFLTKSEKERVAQALHRVGGLALLNKEMSVLSGGELQRVFIARALLLNPKVIILDEPLAAVDTNGRALIMSLMEELKSARDISILLITHSEAVVRQLADRVIFLEKGRLVGWGHTTSMLSHDNLREVAFLGHDHELAISSEEG